MSLVERFEQYAHDFELAVTDGDWSRVESHFCADAVRVEQALPVISLRHEGVEEIIREWRKIVENFDKRFDYRIVVPVGRARVTRNRVTLRWIGAYVVDDAPALLGEGTEIAHYEGDRIKHLETAWTQDTVARNLKWGAEHGPKLPGLLAYAATLAPKSA